MTAALQLPPVGSLRGITIATVLGLLFSTGLRISEVLALDICNFYPQTSRLFVAKGKFRKERWVPLSTSTNDALMSYVKQREQFMLLTPDSPVFINTWKRRLQSQNVSKTLPTLLAQCDISANATYRPRLHDLRHSFAVRRLLRWYQQGADVNNKLPHLATYLGHVNIRSTQVYLHAIPELQQLVCKRSSDYFHQHILGMGGML